MDHSGGITASLAGRYATALFELARADKADAAVEASLERLLNARDQSADLRALIASPIVSRGAAKTAIAAVAGELGLDPLTTRFLGVLADNRRLAELPRIADAFRTLSANARGEVAAEVVTAHPLKPDQVDALTAKLKARSGAAVRLTQRVDPDILGGLVVRIGSEMIDASIKTRLNTLAHAMKG